MENDRRRMVEASGPMLSDGTFQVAIEINRFFLLTGETSTDTVTVQLVVPLSNHNAPR